MGRSANFASAAPVSCTSGQARVCRTQRDVLHEAQRGQTVRRRVVGRQQPHDWRRPARRVTPSAPAAGKGVVLPDQTEHRGANRGPGSAARPAGAGPPGLGNAAVLVTTRRATRSAGGRLKAMPIMPPQSLQHRGPAARRGAALAMVFHQRIEVVPRAQPGCSRSGGCAVAPSCGLSDRPMPT